ncbi:hypothetical protein CVT24_012451 [Panaeolus cyanescens]|uniref:G domain-containing protein n=1 Tax=Panaeolus cyanescens TaxID=181874 RepID=A0A409YYR6_9AGAR|nr:hypothetical protein CVT24_012451 [Panaeolus cyanescens]
MLSSMSVSVHKCVPGEPLDPQSWRCLIMGPTGAGKSSFIEALAGPNSSITNLSSGQLEGFTQEVQGYEINGIECDPRNVVHLIDTPGFADSKISEYEIVSKIKRWMKENDVGYFHRIFYFHPITSTRLAGSQRGVLNSFKELSGINGASGVAIITTMWNLVWGDRAHKRADSNFAQLEGDIWNDFISNGSHIVKFENTHGSAVSILNKLLQKTHVEQFEIERTPGIHSGAYTESLRKDLIMRIHSLRVKHEVITLELASCSRDTDRDLVRILESQLQSAKQDLERFEGQFGLLDSDSSSRSASPPPASVDSGNESDDVISAPVIEKRKGRMARIRESIKRSADRVLHPSRYQK